MGVMQDQLLDPAIVPYVHAALAIANVTMRKLKPLNQTTVDITDFTRGYPETTKAIQGLNMSLDVVELLMTGGNSVKVGAHSWYIEEWNRKRCMWITKRERGDNPLYCNRIFRPYLLRSII